MIDLITSLPTSVTSNVLNNWLKLNAVARLDSAYCNDKRYMLSDIFSALLKYPGASERSLDWLSLRNIPVEDVVLTDSLDITQFRQYCRKFGDKIRVIQLDKVEILRVDILMCITSFCRHLTAFISENSKFDNSMSILLIACPELQEIRLGKFNVLPIIKKPTRMPPREGECDLRSISVSEFAFLEGLLLEKPAAALSTLRLNLNSCNGLTSKGVSAITKFKSLTSLSLYACSLDDNDVIKIITVCPHIVHLDLSISSLVTDVCVTYAVQYLPQLRTLNIELTSITDAALVAVARHRSEHLVALYFADCAAVTAAGVNAILQSCSKLRTMSMATYQSEAFDVPGNISILANLHTLTIEGRHQADDMLESIAKHCKQLRRLRLVCLVANVYEDRGLMALALHCETLTTLVLVGENALHVGRLALALWEKQRPHLTITYDRNVLTYHILDRTECI